jgi:4-diphosphocytidyl-2-C-methyl-D-erythritol kinase
MSEVPTTALTANAKLTVSLRITGVRDDGYHLIDAEMVTLALTDTLTFGDGDALTVSGVHADGVPTDEANLVHKALAVMHRRAAVHIDKRIPAGGGLGGGSADAAAVLRWAGCDDVSVAVRLGADVPFCLAGTPRARVRGIGEIIEPLPFADVAFTLVLPPFGVSTVAVYRAWDDLGGPHGKGPNDLEPAALVVEPRLVTWRDRIAEAAAQTPILAGSGSTWFLLGSHPQLGDALAPAAVVVTRTDRP